MRGYKPLADCSLEQLQYYLQTSSLENTLRKEIRNRINYLIALQEKEDDNLYSQCVKFNDFCEYCKKFPTGRHIDDAVSKIETITWEWSRHSKKGCEKYLLEYPNGLFADQAKKNIEKYVETLHNRKRFSLFIALGILVAFLVFFIFPGEILCFFRYLGYVRPIQSYALCYLGLVFFVIIIGIPLFKIKRINAKKTLKVSLLGLMIGTSLIAILNIFLTEFNVVNCYVLDSYAHVVEYRVDGIGCFIYNRSGVLIDKTKDSNCIYFVADVADDYRLIKMSLHKRRGSGMVYLYNLGGVLLCEYSMKWDNCSSHRNDNESLMNCIKRMLKIRRINYPPYIGIYCENFTYKLEEN